MAILEAQCLKKIYTTRFGGNRVQALSDVTFSVEQGEYVAIMGESGSGKTTLLNILAALDRPTSGQVLLNGRSLSGIRGVGAGGIPPVQFGLCVFRSLICWIPSPCGTILFCRWCWRVGITGRWTGVWSL